MSSLGVTAINASVGTLSAVRHTLVTGTAPTKDTFVTQIARISSVRHFDMLSGGSFKVECLACVPRVGFTDHFKGELTVILWETCIFLNHVVVIR